MPTETWTRAHVEWPESQRFWLPVVLTDCEPKKPSHPNWEPRRKDRIRDSPGRTIMSPSSRLGSGSGCVAEEDGLPGDGFNARLTSSR